MTSEVLLIGNPLLRERSSPVTDFQSQETIKQFAMLKQALDEFRNEKGFGRGISAPQIGILKRIVALNLGQESFIIVNPRITNRSKPVFTMWDDCMSFPHLLIRLERSLSIDVVYEDERGIEHEWKGVDQARSELLQHEIDHLDGILAIDHALDAKSIIYRSEYERNREYYDRLVDYIIKPTISD
ncbi:MULTISPECIES: peptide deformylase [unclassified Mesotoga]|uniref:peptide deformylase n=1 Tax=unclassified Mesotoga TaxID=1184398 RepID=UPI000DA6D0CD|nr:MULTISPECIES: peptide deformylase [unclassified Mesotoga]PZC51698.1 formylmethionine deformylase [Mesotoga sp. TolDC]